ncbi:type II toxin-antitoxin system HicB family antitoxin [Zhihengliuella salsuginis]|uniref:Toxin-antitoxin system HicB family antitoxin n=1 Tax=Zhihengliuella salsuginis TaxID=578222 RepID=A0ABQ3GHR1_9MICC|nr:type II toxin-antitoxin system HicB family antitoxin [Zhihengliuella salsuginis]GHD06278.1 hypothetical protein GCM10008096_16090 [Zhihengliuella salsuginis]
MANEGVRWVAHYRYSVMWSPEDEAYVATVAEFASLSWIADSKAEALSGLEAMLEDVVADLVANGEEIPQPFAERRYSGNLKVRVSPEVHRNVAIAAAEQHVSINRYLSERLASTT